MFRKKSEHVGLPITYADVKNACASSGVKLAGG
jgi:hypothetical protein